MPSHLLPLKGFTPTKTNYSEPREDACLVCQDYSEIDTYAAAVTLDKLHPLMPAAAKKTGGGQLSDVYEKGKFNAAVLFEMLSIANAAIEENKKVIPKEENKKAHPVEEINKVPPVEENKKAHPVEEHKNPLPIEEKIVNIRKSLDKYSLWPDDNAKLPLSKIFSLYANFPLRSLADEIEIIERNQQIVDALRAAKVDTATKESELAAGLDELKKIRKWIDTSRFPEMVRLVAQGLWFQFVKAKHIEADYDPSKDDCVAKARLFHTWLALSIKYDSEMLEDVERFEDDRPAGEVLATKKEVCSGYASMFIDMFNGVPFGLVQVNKGGQQVPETPVARFISGKIRPYGGPEKRSWSSDTVGHAWVAFPTSSEAVLEPTKNAPFKVVDPCLSAPDKGNVMKQEWFSMTNASILMSHIPALSVNQGVKLDPPREYLQLWTDDQPYFPFEGSASFYWIDKSTIKPSTSEVHPDAKGHVTVKFQNNCRHQGPKQAASKKFKFRLGFQAGNKDPNKDTIEEILKGKMSLGPTVHDFKEDVEQKGLGRHSWTATMELTKDKNGWLILCCTESGMFLSSSHRVAMWRVKW